MPATTSQATEHMIQFAVATTSAASAEGIYQLLANVRTHLTWAGEQAPDPKFRLLTLTAPDGLAAVGTEFSSSGAAGKKDKFHDRSVVTEAVPRRAFAFGTDARLDRSNGKTWQTHFTHRYQMREVDGGTQISYTCDVVRGNYRPYWLHPLARPLTRVVVVRTMRKHLINLARLAERET